MDFAVLYSLCFLLGFPRPEEEGHVYFNMASTIDKKAINSRLGCPSSQGERKR
jgi:hypothetical protein